MKKGNRVKPEDWQEAERRIAECAKSGGEELRLAGLELRELPESLQELTHLRDLDLAGNRLRRLPEWLGGLNRLSRLDLRQNNELELPIWLPTLASLTTLIIGGVKTISNVEVIQQMQTLRTLRINFMALRTLPAWLATMSRLETLSVFDCQLSEVPEWIGELHELRILSLAFNRLSRLPNSLSRLVRLESLRLSNNAFSEVPPVLHELAVLQRLELVGNPKLQIPTEILNEENAKKILAYARALSEKGGQRPLNEAKMILVGRGAAGKTTLVHQLVHGKFAVKTKTKGIQVSDWEVRGQEGPVTAHVWDFGGQEIMHGTHQFFLTERSLYLLVLAGREDREDEDAEYWLKMIAAFGGDSPVIVVLNKIKEHRFDLNEEALREKYPNIRAFIETDCKAGAGHKGTGIAKLRKKVIEEINEMESVRAAFPAAWFEIKQRLTDMPENYMSFDRFREICGEHGEKKKDDQEELARFLHLLGVALNYRDDPRLRETSVLNPKWVTTGIYKLLNDAAIRARRGLLKPADPARVLPKQDYPAEMHDFLIRLMKKFELCFPLDDEGREYLIPELLGKKQPKLGDEFDIEKCLCFEYHYRSLLPEGLLPRFIVRAYTRIERDLLWRSGVVLGWKGARALVKADEADKQVVIRVHGPRDMCRELLALIREHFDTIHRNFSKLEPIEKIRLSACPGLLVEYAKMELYARRKAGNFSEYWKEGNELVSIDPDAILNIFELPGARRHARSRGTLDLGEKEPIGITRGGKETP